MDARTLEGDADFEFLKRKAELWSTIKDQPDGRVEKFSNLVPTGQVAARWPTSRRKFLKMIDSARLSKLLTWRDKCGFSESQLLLIKHAFSEHSENGIMNGDILS